MKANLVPCSTGAAKHTLADLDNPSLATLSVIGTSHLATDKHSRCSGISCFCPEMLQMLLI